MENISSPHKTYIRTSLLAHGGQRLADLFFLESWHSLPQQAYQPTTKSSFQPIHFLLLCEKRRKEVEP